MDASDEPAGPEPKLKKGTVLELEIEGVAYGGKGVAKVGGYVVFVNGSLPGDRVLARVTRRKKSFAEAVKVQLLRPSEDRVKPVCRHAAVCGGCTWQELPYGRQLEVKRQHVRESVERIGGLDPSLVQPVLACGRGLGYRNKMEYSFGTRRWLTPEEIASGESFPQDGFYGGLHAPGRFDKILDLQECHLQQPVSFELLDFVREWCRTRNVDAYDPYRHEGFMRNLMIRTSDASGEVMVNVVCNGEDYDLFAALTEDLTAAFPRVSTLMFTINDTRSPVARGDREIVTHGDGWITETLNGYSFRIRSGTFFQTNSRQAENLFRTVREAIPEQAAGGWLLDLYCGVGTAAILLSDRFERCLGLELSPESVAFARENAKINGLSGCEFLAGDVLESISADGVEAFGVPDLVVTDPPRAGMHPGVVRALLELGAPYLIYVSCDPTTLARDLKMLGERYDVGPVRPVDMFPQTTHIETVTLLSLRTGSAAAAATSTSTAVATSTASATAPAPSDASASGA